jgi:hypothetical protein
LAAADRKYVQLQVLPYASAARAPLGGNFTILEFAARDRLVYTEGLASSQIVDEPDAVEKCAMAFDAMRARALSPEDSADLITRMMRDL